MFAIFFSEKMTPFLENIAAFPTIIFTIVLGVSVLYWAVAVLGLVDIDILNLDMDLADMGGDGGYSATDVLAGLLLKFGLQGVPVTIIVSMVSLFGWFFCYYLAYITFSLFSASFFRYLLGIPVFLLSLYLAVMVTGQLIKPIRTLFQKAQHHTEKKVIGQTATVRTSRVDANFGEATLEDGGAGLLLKVRSSDRQYQKGDRVVLLEHNAQNNTYRVVSEQEFSGM